MSVEGNEHMRVALLSCANVLSVVALLIDE